MTASTKNVAQSDAVPTVYSFHSFKGGVGKTTLVLMLAKVLDDSGRKVYVLNLDLYGTPIAKVQEKCDLLRVLLEFDRISEHGFPEWEATKLPVTVEGSNNSSGDEEFYVHHFGVRFESARDFAPLALGEWQCEYLAKRLFKLIQHISHVEEEPPCFIIDNAPGLHGMSESVRRRIIAANEDDGFEGMALFVTTPQSADFQVALQKYDEWQRRSTQGASPRMRFVLNRNRGACASILSKESPLSPLIERKPVEESTYVALAAALGQNLNERVKKGDSPSVLLQRLENDPGQLFKDTWVKPRFLKSEFRLDENTNVDASKEAIPRKLLQEVFQILIDEDPQITKLSDVGRVSLQASGLHPAKLAVLHAPDVERAFERLRQLLPYTRKD